MLELGMHLERQWAAMLNEHCFVACKYCFSCWRLSTVGLLCTSLGLPPQEAPAKVTKAYGQRHSETASLTENNTFMVALGAN